MIKINDVCIGKEEIEAVEEVLKGGLLTDKSGMGPQVLEFERRYSKYIGAKHAIAVSSGTAALHAALLAADVRPEDEIILPSFTFAATANAVLLAGAKPVFADIDRDTYCMRPESVEGLVTRRTKAIIAVDMYGLPIDMAPILEMAHQHDAVVIEDAAQSHGAMCKDRMIGSIADMTCFSFYGAKNMTTGEGGMITSNSDDYASALRMVRTHGEERPYWVTRLGCNYRMTEIEAAIGIVQLQKLPSFLEKRRRNAEMMTQQLSTSGKLILPREPEEMKHSWHLYTVRLRGANAGKRNKVVERLESKGIGAAVYYETPVHLQPLYRDNLSPRKKTLLETEKASRQVLSLPIHPKVFPEDVNYIAENVKKATD
jgi:dTDP-4-amino-4,6-dideoxygalactose transaminase